jgi:hypothetical protein
MYLTTRRQILKFLVGFLIAPIAAAEEQRSPLPPSLATLIVDTGRFRNLQSVREVPDDVRKLAFPDGLPADPGKPWNVTDVVTDRTLPFTGLSWLVTDETHWLFSYAHGGIAYWTGFILVERIGAASPKIVWQAGGADRELRSFDVFRGYVCSNGGFATAKYFGP